MSDEQAIPRKLNIGSGKDFRPDYLNIDINAYWKPDAILDLGKPIPPKLDLLTWRFKNLRLTHGMFDEIIANDVLEHVPDLITCMTNCLNLLRVGGEFKIYVPYDLSYGAWQDPTHIRGFNERSWLYYTDWFWYIGWKTHRFVTTSLSFSPSQLGHDLAAGGPLTDVIIRTPRAIDGMSVTLTKVELNADDIATLNHFVPEVR